MNALTRTLVEAVARRHPKVALDWPDSFAYLVNNHYWEHVMELYGKPLRDRAERMFCTLRSDFADPDDPGRLRPEWYMTRIESRLDEIVMYRLYRAIDRDPELQLTEWGDWLAEVLKPKVTDLPLFKELSR